MKKPIFLYQIIYFLIENYFLIQNNRVFDIKKRITDIKKSNSWYKKFYLYFFLNKTKIIRKKMEFVIKKSSWYFISKTQIDFFISRKKNIEYIVKRRAEVPFYNSFCISWYQKSILDKKKRSISWYEKIDDIKKSIRFLDIKKSIQFLCIKNFWYQEMGLISWYKKSISIYQHHFQ